jgi:hypothetical protein
MPMRTEKEQQLDSAGWRLGTAEELLDLTPEEAAVVELRLKRADAIRERRKERDLTQAALAHQVSDSRA